MATMDQVVWASANVVAGGEARAFMRGELLPEPADADEANQRTLLRLGGALRTVEVVYSPEELAEQAKARGDETARRESALDVDPSAPAGSQMAGEGAPGVSTLVGPSGAPVVIGDEDMRAEHTEQAKAAQARRDQAEGKPPGASASKAAWVDFAVDHRGADRDAAKDMTRDELRAEYGQDTRPEPAEHASPNPGPAAAAVAARQAAPRNDPGPAPAQDASEARWREYAAAKGADPGKLGGLSKDQLIAAYGPASG